MINSGTSDTALNIIKSWREASNFNPVSAHTDNLHGSNMPVRSWTLCLAFQASEACLSVYCNLYNGVSPIQAGDARTRYRCWALQPKAGCL